MRRAARIERSREAATPSRTDTSSPLRVRDGCTRRTDAAASNDSPTSGRSAVRFGHLLVLEHSPLLLETLELLFPELCAARRTSTGIDARVDRRGGPLHGFRVRDGGCCVSWWRDLVGLVDRAADRA